MERDTGSQPPQQLQAQSEDERAWNIQHVAKLAVLWFLREIRHQLKEQAKFGIRPPIPQYLQVPLPPWAVAKTEKMLSDAADRSPNTDQEQ